MKAKKDRERAHEGKRERPKVRPVGEKNSRNIVYMAKSTVHNKVKFGLGLSHSNCLNDQQTTDTTTTTTAKATVIATASIYSQIR